MQIDTAQAEIARLAILEITAQTLIGAAITFPALWLARKAGRIDPSAHVDALQDAIDTLRERIQDCEERAIDQRRELAKARSERDTVVELKLSAENRNRQLRAGALRLIYQIESLDIDPVWKPD